MKAMILGAGKGTRVRPITGTVPKPMICLAGKPVLEFIIEHLVSQGFDEIVINTSYLSDAIESYFRDGSRYGARIAYSFEGALVDGALEGSAVGSAGGMRKIQDFSGFFTDTFAVLCGDAVIDLDLREAVAFHKKSKALATIVLKEVDRSEVSSYGIVEVADDGRIVRFQEKPRPEEAISCVANTGIYLFEPEIFNYIPSGVEYDIGSQLFPALVAAGAPLFGVTLPFTWLDIGSVSSYWDAVHRLLAGELRGYRPAGEEIAPGVFAGVNLAMNRDNVTIRPPVVIGGSVAIGDGAVIIGPTVIGPGSVIEAGAVVEECLVDGYTRISGIATVKQKIIFGGHCITPQGNAITIAEHDIGWIIDDARHKQELSPLQQALMELAEGL